MNEIMNAILERRSVKKYQDRQVPEEVLDQILEAGTYAANGMGAQSPLIVAVQNPETRDRLSRMNAEIMGTSADPFYGAPTVVVVLADANRPTCVEDGSLVIGNMMLAAWSLGVNSCWIHRARQEFDSEEGRALLKEWGIEGNYIGVGHCILGYAAGDIPAAKPRKADYIRKIR